MNIAWIADVIILVVLVAMLLARIPIAIALAVSSICVILPILEFEPAVPTGAQGILFGISVLNLIIIPFSILTGSIMNEGGIAIRLISFAKLFTRRIPGALTYTNVVANMLFGTISGSGTTAASAMDSIIGSVEEEEGYDGDSSAAVNTVTAPTGLLTPPSDVMTIYTLVSGGIFIATLFMVGYIPGVIQGLSCMIVACLIAERKGYKSTRRSSGKEKLNIAFQAIPCPLTIVTVIGGIIGGISTATGGAVVAMVYSLVLSLFFYRSISWWDLPWIFRDSAEVTSTTTSLVGVPSIMFWAIAFIRPLETISDAMLSIGNNRYVILIIIDTLLLIVGVFMDMMLVCLTSTPIFLPICQQIGMNSVCFGIMMIFSLCISTITPPVGTILFVDVRVGRMKIEDMVRPLLYYFAAIFFVLPPMTHIPALSIQLPGLLGYVQTQASCGYVMVRASI